MELENLILIPNSIKKNLYDNKEFKDIIEFLNIDNMESGGKWGEYDFFLNMLIMQCIYVYEKEGEVHFLNGKIIRDKIMEELRNPITEKEQLEEIEDQFKKLKVYIPTDFYSKITYFITLSKKIGKLYPSKVLMDILEHFKHFKPKTEKEELEELEEIIKETLQK